MTRSKKVFIAILIAFFIGLVALAIDISRKTSFPGSKKKLKHAFKMELTDKLHLAQSISSPKSTTYQL
jgi:hypothetical protein